LLALFLVLVMFVGVIMPVSADVAQDQANAAAELQALVDGAAAGDTITLTRDFDIGAATINVAADDDFTLDLNGHSITGSADVRNHALLRNSGSLRIVGNGEIVYTFTGEADNTYGSGNYTIVNSGTLVVDNGTIRNATAAMSHCFIAIDNNSTSRDVSLTVNGGSVICDNYRSIRQFANSDTHTNDVVVNGGEIIGQIWLQSPNSKQNMATLTINGGTVSPRGNDSSAVFVTHTSSTSIETSVTGGHFEGKIGTDNVAHMADAITGGTFTAEAHAATNPDLLTNVAMTQNADGTLTAAPVDVEDTTIVTYTGTGTKQYVLSVPATMAPGASETISLTGTWPFNERVVVEAQDKVTMYHDLKKSDTKVLDVTFAPIELDGDNCFEVAADSLISVADITNALFGTWTGTINYTLTFETIN